mmetsp:Transcript_9797/g.14860  ORF Transcript_9797/g.14860 Transcript_9797/m.14860 type:complete len:157 (-) Transcript_9797:78-548(-)
MKDELKDLKQIIKVPRLHFKEIEKSDYNSLRSQYELYKKQEGHLISETGLSRSELRARQLTKKETDQAQSARESKGQPDKDTHGTGTGMKDRTQSRNLSLRINESIRDHSIAHGNQKTSLNILNKTLDEGFGSSGEKADVRGYQAEGSRKYYDFGF